MINASSTSYIQILNGTYLNRWITFYVIMDANGEITFFCAVNSSNMYKLSPI